MRSLIKLSLSAILALTAVSCEKPYWYVETRFSILQVLLNNQPNTVYNKTMVTYGGKNEYSVYSCDTIYFNRTIKPEGAAEINIEDVLELGITSVDTVSFLIELSDSQNFYQKFPRTYIRDKNKNINDFIETIRF